MKFNYLTEIISVVDGEDFHQPTHPIGTLERVIKQAISLELSTNQFGETAVYKIIDTNPIMLEEVGYVNRSGEYFEADPNKRYIATIDKDSYYDELEINIIDIKSESTPGNLPKSAIGFSMFYDPWETAYGEVADKARSFANEIDYPYYDNIEDEDLIEQVIACSKEDWDHIDHLYDPDPETFDTNVDRWVLDHFKLF